MVFVNNKKLGIVTETKLSSYQYLQCSSLSIISGKFSEISLFLIYSNRKNIVVLYHDVHNVRRKIS